jgi:hypothetical protein
MLYVLKKEQVEHARIRALAQAIIAKEKGQEVFEEYMKIAFPWLETQKKRDKADHVRLLMEEVAKVRASGGLTVTPMASGQVRSRMKTRYLERAPEPAKPARSKKDLDELYKQLGKKNTLT